MVTATSVPAATDEGTLILVAEAPDRSSSALRFRIEVERIVAIRIIHKLRSVGALID